MSKRESAIRQQQIIRKLQNIKRATFEEIHDFLLRQSEALDYNLDISIRTFQRDIRDIQEIHRVYIKYNRSGKYYFIEDDDDSEINNRALDAFDEYNALKLIEHSKQYIYFDGRQTTRGSEHLHGLLHAIKNRLQVSFTYQKFYEEQVSQRTVAPLALKEFKNRWYLIAHKVSNKEIRTYPLDRISDLEISKNKFQKDPNFDLKQMMKYSFGIITPSDKKPEKVILSFHPFQGKYIKSLPLHETQKILIDNEKELRISLDIHPEHDFKMEILSLGDTVKVLEPKKFAKELKDTYRAALEQY
jgi:predicted DNA-binding transcriptional regulator YafY